MTVLRLDWETRSTIDLRKTGVYRYAQHPTTDLWCGAWAFDDEEPEVWFPGQPVPQRIVDHVNAGGEVRAWNAAFERIIWKYIAGPRYGWPEARLEQFVCSAAEAAAMNLPRALGMAAAVTKVEVQKDDVGYRLMLQMCRPRKIHPDGRIEWWDVPEKVARLADYCKQDVCTEGRLDKALLRLVPREREIYLLDQRINDRGVYIDRALVTAAMTMSEEGVLRANADIQALTEGAVQKVSNTGKLREWLNANGVPTDSVDKATLVELLEGNLEDKIRQALELRQEAGRSSLKKLDAMLEVMCDDNIARGLLLYHAAGTGRWGGRLIQPQNFPRGNIKNIEQFIDAVLAGDYEYIDLFHHPLIVLSFLLRSMLTARPGYELIAADYSAIEARVLNWLAGQEDVVQNFRDFDAGDKSKNPYKIMAVKMGRGKSVDDIVKPSDDYQAGKAAELGCGFGMGWEKFISAAWTVYQLRVDAKEAKSAVDIYRATHSMVKRYWREVEDAALAAVTTPGALFAAGPSQNVKYVKAGGYLYCILPSGRPLLYAQPKIIERPRPWCKHCGKNQSDHLTGQDLWEQAKREGWALPAGAINHDYIPHTGPALEYSACDEQTGKWNRYNTYGGHLVENIVQAVARDLLAEGLLRAEQRGYPPVLSVHDEGVCEVPLGQGSVKELESIMSELPEWATGCPVAAEGWKGLRYRK